MPGFVESIGTINSAVRTVLALAVVGVVTVGGWIGYREYNAADIALKEKDQELEQRQQRIDALEKDLEIVKARAEKLATSLRLLKVEKRLAYIDVLDQGMENGKTVTTVRFTEVDGDKNDTPISQPQEFKLLGKRIYVDGLKVAFEDEYVEGADELRGKPIFIFNRIFGDEQPPSEGPTIDKPGERPAPYATPRKVSEFEQEIWDNFWDIVHDPQKRKKYGANHAQGDAPSQQVRVGQRYEFRLRATGNAIFEHVGDMPKPPAPTL